jgi:hypothetical protein
MNFVTNNHGFSSALSREGVLNQRLIGITNKYEGENSAMSIKVSKPT